MNLKKNKLSRPDHGVIGEPLKVWPPRCKASKRSSVTYIQTYSLTVEHNKMYVVYNLLRHGTCGKNQEQLVSVYRVKYFLQVDEDNGCFILMVSSITDDTFDSKNMR